MKKLIGSVLLVLSLIILGNALVSQPTLAAVCDEDGNRRILTFPYWYRGIVKDVTKNGNIVGCDIDTDKDNWIGLLVLNIGDILAQAAGYIAVGFIIYGGIKYVLSAGTAAGVESAKKTITNALIGLVISVLAVVIVNTIFKVIS